MKHLFPAMVNVARVICCVIEGTLRVIGRKSAKKERVQFFFDREECKKLRFKAEKIYTMNFKHVGAISCPVLAHSDCSR